MNSNENSVDFIITGDITWTPEINAEKAFASFLTYTIKDFSNWFHRDNDISENTFGIWFPTWREGTCFLLIESHILTIFCRF